MKKRIESELSRMIANLPKPWTAAEQKKWWKEKQKAGAQLIIKVGKSWLSTGGKKEINDIERRK